MNAQPQQTPPNTPLDDLLQTELAPHIGAQATQGCLVLVPAQTGIGKTHSIKQLILTELLATLQSGLPGKPIYYITNSVDNVYQTHNELLQLIDEQLPETIAKLLKQQVLYLPNQAGQLLDMDLTKLDNIMQLFAISSDSLAGRAWQEVRSLKALIKPSAEATLRKTLEDKASDCYSLLVSAIQSRQRGSSPLELSATEQGWLDSLLPGDRLQRGAAQVAFLTTSKFLHGYQSLRSKIHPIRELSSSLLLIDEFDRQNEVILQFMTKQTALDLIELTRTLHSNLQYHQVEQSSRYAGIEQRFAQLQSELSDFAQRWQLQYAFNIQGANLADETVRLFSDRTITHAHSSQHYFGLEADHPLRKNIIQSTSKGETVTDQDEAIRLSQFINQADRIFRRFISTMRRAVGLYQRNANQEQRLDNATLYEAVQSILRHFNLQALSDIVLAAFDIQASFTGQYDSQNLAREQVSARTYHDRGLKLVDVRLNPGTQDTVGCYFTGLGVTPSGLLARLVEGGTRVVGISATATAQTVIKNFDLNYLQTRLGDKFIQLTPAQRKAIGDWYRSRRNYAAAGVQIEAQFIHEDLELIRSALAIHSGRAPAKPAMALGHLLGKEEDNYSVGRFSKLLAAMQQFIVAEHNRYMLAFLNLTLAHDRQPAFIDFLNSFLTHQAKAVGVKVQLFDGMSSAAIKHGHFDRLQQQLSTTTDKIIMLSTYPSTGEGKNPDYPALHPEDQPLLWVGAGEPPQQIRTDIDCIYLERPSHQLLSSNDDQENQLLLFHQVMALQEDSWISPKQAYLWVKRILQGQQHQQNLAEYYTTEDHLWLTRKQIEQAVGRSARTAFKRPVIRIFADSGLKPLLAGDLRPADSLSLEYLALRDAANQGAPPTIHSTSQRQHNMAARNTQDSLVLIAELIKGFRGSTPESSISNWQALRQQLLSAPTLSQLSGNFPRLYLESPTANSYRFSGNLEIDQNYSANQRALKFFEQASDQRLVNESSSGLSQLMKNPIVKAHFVNQGWATQWQNNPYLMTPAAFLNLYKGALGEEGISALLQQAGLNLAPLPKEVYESCDMLLYPQAGQPPIGIDAKNWQSPGWAKNHANKIKRLGEHLGLQRLAYINLFTQPEANNNCLYLCHELRPYPGRNSPVIAIPGLIDPLSGATQQEHLNALIEWMSKPYEADTQ